MRKAKTITRVVAINVAVLIVGLVFLELLFGNWVQHDRTKRLLVPRDVDVAFNIGDLYESDQPTIRYKRDRFGLRGSYVAPDKIDILTVGGSTTDQRFLDETATWQYRLARRFETSGADVSVVNAGVDGQAVYGHIKSFDWWFPAVPEMHAEYVLLYVGINDFYCDLGCIESHRLARRSGFFKLMEQNSALYNLYQTLKGMRTARNAGLSHGKYRIDFGSASWTASTLVADHSLIMRKRLDAYAERLQSLLERVRSWGATPICVTQPIRTHQLVGNQRLGLVDRERFSDGVAINGLDRYHMMHLLNDRTSAVCLGNDALTIDAAYGISWDNDDFYDVTHNTPAGAEKLADFLYGKLKSLSFD